MACKLAENRPLMMLRRELGLKAECHSLRPNCVMGHERRNGQYALGAPGAVIGYCQALFNYAGEPALHSEVVARNLADIRAPWTLSHELFWGYRQDEDASRYVGQGMRPLLGSGRVPILITGLDPARDRQAIDGIVSTSPPIHANETVLVRIVLNANNSIAQTSDLIVTILAQSRTTRLMPCWWPLLQGSIGVDGWIALRKRLGDDWKYTNFAVNPFTADEVFRANHEQVTVAQIPIGLARGMTDDGDITLAPRMRIGGAPEGATYNLFSYFDRLATLQDVPTLIVLGPSLPEWTQEANRHRIAALLPLLRRACDTLWKPLAVAQREVVWKMSA